MPKNLGSTRDLDSHVLAKGHRDLPLNPSSSEGNGHGADTVCKCGAPPHEEREDMCARGHFIQGNVAAVVSGSRSVQFWEEHDADKRERVREVLVARGEDPKDPDPGMLAAAQGFAQSCIVRDSAYYRMAQEGGPLSSSGKVRRVFVVWKESADKVLRHLEKLGLRREPRPAPSLGEELERIRNRQEASP